MAEFYVQLQDVQGNVPGEWARQQVEEKEITTGGSALFIAPDDLEPTPLPYLAIRQEGQDPPLALLKVNIVAENGSQSTVSWPQLIIISGEEYRRALASAHERSRSTATPDEPKLPKKLRLAEAKLQALEDLTQAYLAGRVPEEDYQIGVSRILRGGEE